MANISFNTNNAKRNDVSGTYVDKPIKGGNGETIVTWADMIDWGEFDLTINGESRPVRNTYQSLIDALQWMCAKAGGGSTPTPSPISVTGVSIYPTSTSVTVGNTVSLTATVTPSDATNKSVTWSSSNTSVATVNGNGVVTGVSVGSANITVKTSDGNKTATCSVSVVQGTVSVTGVSLSTNSTSVTVGSTVTLYATVTPPNATNQGVTWSSSNTSVATVNNGVVTGVGVGDATITVRTNDGNKTATCSVTVIQGTVSVTGVSLSSISRSINTGDTFTLTATVSPPNATNKSVTWSSSNTSVATVNNNGVVTGVGAGNVIITATTNDGNKTATCSVLVTNPIISVTGVSLSSTSRSINTGDTFTLTATVTPPNATNKGVTWSSSNTGIATVNNGVVTGISAGNVTITVKTNDGNKTATCSVSVVQPGQYWFSYGSTPITASNYTTANNATKVNSYPSEITYTTFTRDYLYILVKSNQSVQVIDTATQAVAYTSENTSTISGYKIVSTNGKVGGNVYIRISEGGSSTISVTSVSVSPTSTSVNVGSTVSLSAIINPSTATNKSVTWSSSNTSVATVNNNGVVTGVSVGSANITVKTSDGNKTATCSVTVTQPSPVNSYWFSYGSTEISASNYTTANNATKVSSYPSEVEYTPSSRSYLYVLVKDNKNVQVIDATTQAVAYTSENTSTVSGYKIVKPNGKVGGKVYIRIS